jgi:hypothetical protein
MKKYPQGFYDPTPAILPRDSLHWYETPRCTLIDMSKCVCTLVTLLDINMLRVTRNMVMFMLFSHTHTLVAKGMCLTDIASATATPKGFNGAMFCRVLIENTILHSWPRGKEWYIKNTICMF